MEAAGSAEVVVPTH